MNIETPFTKEQQAAYDKSALLCSKSEKCSSEMLDKIMQWGLSKDQAQQVVSKLITDKFVDDQRYATAFAKDKFRFNHWGKQKISYMLHSKKISSGIIELALLEIEDENYDDLLLKLLNDKSKTIKSANPYEKKNKLLHFAMSKGFESSRIYEALKKLEL